ncbi:hypothetical protein DFW101_1265 [Solidesulfovibrio carbinoliphilus subsp. oakridgensis]|uniref:Uncharacterized protein n=1 Tax=Solidesulfovibrio carbinoliphilus subsp. oakridgensis TaxID=694327 RepID=G7Q6A2_9BACT|nr:hypothetical protein [Solidesulfovibrio carbinoliphilus]EHJ47275.1 hypothetical protein DFW101_1265 [Solidesulfovibrio carbinoliphilus subsp. oakridgensis]
MESKFNDFIDWINSIGRWALFFLVLIICFFVIVSRPMSEKRIMHVGMVLQFLRFFISIVDLIILKKKLKIPNYRSRFHDSFNLCPLKESESVVCRMAEIPVGFRILDHSVIIDESSKNSLEERINKLEKEIDSINKMEENKFNFFKKEILRIENNINHHFGFQGIEIKVIKDVLDASVVSSAYNAEVSITLFLLGATLSTLPVEILRLWASVVNSCNSLTFCF